MFPSLKFLFTLSATTALAIGTLATSVLAQTSDTPNQDVTPPVAAEPVTEKTDEPVAMAAIERAYAAGDFESARSGLQALATQNASGMVHYRYGRILLDSRAGAPDPHAAIPVLQRAVDLDYGPAATLLARLFLSGGAVARDPQRAADLLRESATRGESDAQYYLAVLLEAGDGSAADPRDAFLWFRAAAEQGHTEAAYELSRLFSRGIGTEMDTAKALKWLDRAAQDGHSEAQLFLAKAYDTGVGAPQDRNHAWDLYRQAAEGGQTLAMRIIGTKYMTGDGVYADAAKAQKWLSAAADLGDAGAMFNLAVMYAEGTLIPQDDVQALRLLQQASEAGLLRARTLHAAFIETGRGTDDQGDLDKAVALYREAATSGDNTAQAALRRLALAGALDDLLAPHLLVPWVQDGLVDAQTGETDSGAVQWLSEMSDAGNRAAQTALATHLMAQDGQQTAGANLLIRAAEAGDLTAQYLLADAYSTGTGVPSDFVNAHKWLNIAAAQGHKDAAADRAVLTDLMTAEQLAQAQNAARAFLENPPPPVLDARP